MAKGREKMELRSGLVGRQQVGQLALAAALAAEFGLTKKQIKAGVAKTKPLAHHMQPYQLHGAWVIDDAAASTIEGFRAGARLLADLPGKRKVYITPGLAGQGKGSMAVNEELGHIIAGAKPDYVVLMEHAVTPAIQKGLEAANYGGETLIEDDPTTFYANLKLFVATGDLVLMQGGRPEDGE
jgi:UDP-N-acetylmuramyl pentapeptide synthase